MPKYQGESEDSTASKKERMKIKKKKALALRYPLNPTPRQRKMHFQRGELKGHDAVTSSILRAERKAAEEQEEGDLATMNEKMNYNYEREWKQTGERAKSRKRLLEKHKKELRALPKTKKNVS